MSDNGKCEQRRQRLAGSVRRPAWKRRQIRPGKGTNKAAAGRFHSTGCRRRISSPEFADAQLKTRWKEGFDKRLQRIHPTQRELVDRGQPVEYFWSLEQSEWATDVMFRLPQDLADFYPHLLRHGLHDFSSRDVMRFLWRKTQIHGGVRGNSQGEVVSNMGRRANHFLCLTLLGRSKFPSVHVVREAAASA